MRIELSGAVQFADKNFVHRTISSANCQQNWQLLKRQLQLAVETANRNWRQFWSQPRLRSPVK